MTQDEKQMVKYFHIEKDDITRWSEWEEKKELFRIEGEHHLVEAVEDLLKARRRLDLEVERL